MIADLLVRLEPMTVEADVDRLLDALWLASMLPQRTKKSTLDTREHAESQPYESQPSSPKKFTVTTGSLPVDPVHVKPIEVPRPKRDGFAGVPLRADDLPQPLAVGRALRPLRYRRPAAIATELDEVATADRSARAGGDSWLPVLRAPMRRWPDVAVLAETESNLWNARLAEVNLVLRRLGAFRQHREWRLNPPLRDSRHATIAPGFADDPGPECAAERLIDPTGRRLLLVLTDGASSGWSSGAYRDLFNRWARTNPVGIISLVAPRMLPANGMRPTTRPIQVSGPWLPNERWLAPGPAYPPIPITDLTPARLAPFAALFAGPGSTDAGELLTLAPVTTAQSAPPTPERPPASPGDAVRRTRARLRPSVFWLLVGLSTTPLIPGPLLDRARSVIAPDATVDDLAEMLRSKLLTPFVVRDSRGHSRVLGYRFRDSEVRDELTLWRSQADRSLLYWDLFDYGTKSLAMPEEDVNDLLTSPDERDALARVLFRRTKVEQVDPNVTSGHRHFAVQAVQRARRVQAVRDMAANLAAAGLLERPQPEIVAAAELLEPVRRKVLLGRPDRLLAVDDLDALHDDHEPRRRRALDSLLAAMTDDQGPIVALCGDRGHLHPLYDIRPRLHRLTNTLTLSTTRGDELFTLLNGLINSHQLRWAAGVRQDAWLAVCRWQSTVGDSDIYALAFAAFRELVRRWQLRSNNDLSYPLAREDLLMFTETDVPRWLVANS